MRERPGIPAKATERLGLFTLAEAQASGWSTDALRHAVDHGRLVRYRPGIFGVPPASPGNDYEAARRGLTVAAIAGGLANPTSVVSHASAAALHGLPLWYQPSRPCLTVPPRFVGDIEGAHLHRARTPLGHLAGGTVAATSIERTVIDLGREHGLLSAVVAADAALHAGTTDALMLRRLLRDCRGWPGVRAAREAVELADARSESPLESVSRVKLRERVPRPEVQASVFDAHGTFLGRPDLLWEEFGVVGEVDGMLKYDNDPEQLSLRKEKLRQEGFERAELIVVRWGRSDLNDLDRLVDRLEIAFARGARNTSARRWTVRKAA